MRKIDMKIDPTKQKYLLRMRRHARIRARVRGTADIPRLSVFRSSRYVRLQLIDDARGITLASVTDRPAKKVSTKSKPGTKSVRAREAGKEIARLAKEKNISRVVFDRGGFAFHGRIKETAEGAREGGLKF